MHSRVVTATPSAAKNFCESATKIGSDSDARETAIVTGCAGHAPAARASAIAQANDSHVRSQRGAVQGRPMSLFAQHACETGGELARRQRLLHHLVRPRLACAARHRAADVA